MNLRAPIFIVLLLASFSLAAAEYIESFHSDIEISRNGDLHVIETIVVKAEGTQIRRGIYRDFPTRYQDSRGNDHVVGFVVLAVKRDGSDEPFHLKDRSNGKRVYIGDANVILSPGFYEYQISYRTTRQLGFFDDFDELYWNVTGTDWAFSIDQASAMVTLPGAIEDFNLTGYTGPRGSTAQDLTYRRVDSNRVYFETSQPLGRREGLTIVAGWPKGIIDEPSDVQRRAWFIEDNKPTLIVVAGAIVLLVYYWLAWLRVGKDPEAGVIVPHYQAPAGYSPASMRYVQAMDYDKKCFTAAIVNLAVKGAVEINDDDGDFNVIKKQGLTPSLAPGESQVLEGLFGDGSGDISITRSNHSILSKAIKQHKKSLNDDYNHKYFETNRWFLAPGILLTIAVVALTIKSIGSVETIFNTIFIGVFTMMPLLMLFTMFRGLRRRGVSGKIQIAVNAIAVFGMIGFIKASDLPIGEFTESASWLLVAAIVLMLMASYFFSQWLKAPTLAGRRLLDKIEGFKHYLKVAEEEEIALQGAPEFTTDIYETYLPYAIALDLENEWTAKLNHAITLGIVDQSYARPGWYHGRSDSATHFSSTLSSSFDSAIASSSVAPGSSSGSSGGSSGGGGGGGGGGGW